MAYFNEKRAFGIVDVMNIAVYEGPNATTLTNWATQTPAQILNALTSSSAIAKLSYLQSVNLTFDGPDITINGGMGSQTLLKAGKSARCEITDALGEPEALVALGGATIDANGIITITNGFPGAKTLVGDTYVVDQATGQHAPVKVLIYQMLPDAITSYSFGNEAATFDLSGDVVETTIGVTTAADANNTCGTGSAAFVSIVPVTNCKIGGNTVDGSAAE